jgi:hypothetical protein
MSNFTHTTYTSVAPRTTPPTSLSNSSSTAQSAHSSKAPDHPLSVVVLHDNDTAVLPSNPEDAELRFAVKGTALLIGALVELRILVSFLDSFIMICIGIVLLWLVCGGHASLCEDNLAPLAPDVPSNIACKVETWLDGVCPSSAAAPQESLEHNDVASAKDSSYSDEKHSATEWSLVDERDLADLSSLITSSDGTQESRFLDFFCSFVGVFDEPDGQVDKLASENELIEVVHEDSLTQDVLAPENRGFQSAIDECASGELVQNNFSGEETFKEDELMSAADTPRLVSETQGHTELQLAYLLEQHEYPIFVDSDNLTAAYTDHAWHNANDPVFSDHVSEQCSNGCQPSWPG